RGGPRGGGRAGPRPAAAVKAVESPKSGDVLRDIMDTKDRGASHGRHEIGRHGSNERSLDAVTGQRAEKGLPRDTDQNRESVILKVWDPHQGFDILKRGFAEAQAG